VPVSVPVRRLLRGGDQLGEHAGERVHLMAAKLGARREMRRLLRENALEPEQQRVEHLPLRRRLLAPCGDLRQGVVERAPARGARCENAVRLLVAAEDGLAGPGFGPEGVDPNGRRFLRVSRRVRDGF